MYLVAESKGGKVVAVCENNEFTVTLTGLNNNNNLTVKEIKGVNTQPDRKNEVTTANGVTTQISNNGKHMIAVTLEADGKDITDPSEVIYALSDNQNLGMTSPESTGSDTPYTYGVYMKYKNGDYTAADAGEKNYNVKLIAVGKGSADLKFVLRAEEYTAA